MDSGFLIHTPPHLKGNILDMYLAAGWYRFGNKIFTIDYFTENEEIYLVYWLRYNIQKFTWSKSSKKLLNKNKQFSVIIKPFENTEELERLHSHYFENIDFVTTSTIEELLEDTSGRFYNTMLIEIRDAGRLIAAGIFDHGSNSIAGIKNIFHPDYKKYSLGKYLMLVKCDYCIREKLLWYYPGYFAPGYKKFDYKLSIDPEATEVCLTDTRKWISYREFVSIG